MANTIEYAKKYVTLLDEVYMNSALTADLESDPELAREGANANEIVIPKLKMDGLGDYDRNDGYTKGDIEFKWETVKFNYERGRGFNLDSMDEEETLNVIAPKVMGEFARTKVAPEGDAFTLATLAGKTGITSVAGALADGVAVIQALRAGVTKQDEDQVSMENRFLYITPTLHAMISDLDTTKSREVLARFAKIVDVPQSRFYTAITMNDGKTTGEETGGYAKATDAKDINFMIVEKSAVMKYDKHIAPKIIAPDANQTADAYFFGYRKYGLVDVYENKVAGIYLHHAA
jgi:hypothetical protein